eukprot:g6366.t1
MLADHVGAGASTADIPDKVDKETAQKLAGDKWNDASAAKFDEMAEDGAVTKEQFEAAVAEEGKDAAPAAEAAPAAARGGRRRYSLVGTEAEGAESLADASKTRRASIVAQDTNNDVDNAPAEEKVGVLLEAMKTEWAKPADETKGDEEFFSWALSCVASLSQGSEENRAKLLEGGAVDLILQYMDVTGRFGDDIFVQWQGTQAIGNFCCDEATADAFGEKGLEAVIYPMLNTDCSELSFTGMRALKQLITNSEKNKAAAIERDVAGSLTQLTEDYPSYNQLKFMVADMKEKLGAGADGSA